MAYNGDNLKTNKPRWYKINHSLLMKKPTCQPLLWPNGLVYDPETKSELFITELKKQFTCPKGTVTINNHVSQTANILNLPRLRDIQPIFPLKVWNIIKKNLSLRKIPLALAESPIHPTETHRKKWSYTSRKSITTALA